MSQRLRVDEVFGLAPLSVRFREAVLAFRGGQGTPPSRFDATSLAMMMPLLSLRTWAGARRGDRLVPIYNLFNRTPTPLEDGWSTRKTQVRDFRGGTLTYDSHNGTDLVVPPGTIVVAAATGKVLRVSSEFNRGGLKVFIDHGRGLATTSNHLARALVRVGDVVRCGDPIALSGYSGLDGFLTFPWGAPHVHFNVWLDGEYADPFAEPGEVSLWTRHNDPRPRVDRDAYDPTAWDARGVADAIDACDDDAIRDELAREPDLDRRAMSLLFYRNYYPTRFRSAPRVVARAHAREPRLALPFRAEDFDGIVFPR